MADHPDAPPLLVDVVMQSYGARSLRHVTRDVLSDGDLRTDVSDIVACVLHLLRPRPPEGVQERRGSLRIDLDALDARSRSTAH